MTCTAVPRTFGLCTKHFALVAASLLLCASIAHSQDAIRPSLAGEQASEARQQDIERIPYNLMAGPIRFRFSATVGVEYNDNINLAQHDEKQDDVIFRPQVNFDAIWPITQLNTLRFDLGIGYSAYVMHPDNDTNAILLSPGTQIAFDIFVGDFRINIHDRMSLQQDPISEGALSNTADYGLFENTAGVSVLWDLNKILLTAGYDHYLFKSTTDQFDYLDHNSDILNGSAALALTNTMNIGAEATGVFTYYDGDVMNDSTDYSVGGFLESQLSTYLHFRAAGGYQHMRFDRGGLILDNSDASDYYANILITHRLNAMLSQSVSAGHENQLGVNSNYITLNYIRHTITWNVVRNTLLTTEFFYEDGNESGGFLDEHFHRVGAAGTIGYQLTPHITLGLRYQYTQKDSDTPGRNYIQNRVSLDGTYSF
jgi:opacity protein-like surface antigen